MMQHPRLAFPQFCAFLTSCIAQSAHNFKAVFLIDRTTLWQPVSFYPLSCQSQQNACLSSVSSVLERGKSQRWSSPLNTVVEAWLWFFFFFWSKTHAQASLCELGGYHGGKSMIGFSAILCISDELLRAIGAWLQGSIPYWPYDHAIAIDENSQENLHILSNLTNCFAHLAHNFKVVFLIHRTTLWQEFMMHHVIAIEENSRQNFYSKPKLLALLYASIGMIGLWF